MLQTRQVGAAHVSGSLLFDVTADDLRALAIVSVYVIAAVKQERLAQLAEDVGASYRHEPLRSGSSPSAYRRCCAAVRRLLKAGPVLLVGETDSGPAWRIANEVARG